MAKLFSFSISHDQDLRRGLSTTIDVAKDLRPFWRTVFAPKYYAMVQDLFATGGRARSGSGHFKGGAWAPLSPAYRVWKRAHYPGQPILVREGTLRESLRWSGTVGDQGIFNAQPQYAFVGTKVKYGVYHQHGTSRMPARPFLPEPDAKVFGPLLNQWLQKVMKTGSQKG